MTARGNWWYSLLLSLLPSQFRRRYGRAMHDFHRDRLAEARLAGESVAATWLRIAGDVLATALAERLRPSDPSTQIEKPAMGTLRQDIGYGLRGLLRRPAFTAVIVGTIALGMGANAAIFSVVSGIILRPLPYPNAERVFSFGHEAPHWLASDRDFIDYRGGIPAIDKLAAYTRTSATLDTDGEPDRVRAAVTTEDFFPALGVRPLLGRTFHPDEFSGGPRRIVISHSLWVHRFGADSGIVGRQIRLNGSMRDVIGVMPPHFNYPEARTDIWVPMRAFNRDSLGDRANHYLFMVGRLKPDATLDRARREAALAAQRIMKTDPGKFDPKFPLIPRLSNVEEDLVGKTRPYLVALLGAVAFVLLIACANVANLLLVRGEGRRREMALRTALGASRWRLFVQLFTEGSLLAACGAVVGLALAAAATRVLVAAAPASLPRIDEVGLDWRVFVYTGAATILTALLIGVVPALRAAGESPSEVLKDAGRSSGGGATLRARRALIVAEVALAVVMLTGAGILLRSLVNLHKGGTGFTTNVLTARVSLPQMGYSDERTAAFFERLTTELRAQRDVAAVGAAGWLPVVDAGGQWGFRPEGTTYADYDGRWPLAVPQQATPGYFAAAGIPLVAGRDFTPADRPGRELVAVVSEKFAELAWPTQNPLGRRFRLSIDSIYVTVVGVVGDVRARGFGDRPEATMYFAHAQSAQSAYYMPRTMSLLVRTIGEPMAAVTGIRRAVKALDPSVPVSEVRTLEYIIGTSVANRRFSTSLLIGFAALALVLAGIGTYGVISFGVTQRRYEIGVRMALGAERRSVLAMVMWEGGRMAALGLLIGLAASLAVGRLLRSLLVGVGAFDLPTFISVTALLAVVAVIAAAVPARRASGISPVEALRSD